MQLFTYGLLRPGEVYWPELEPAVRSRRAARVRGSLYLHEAGAYPLLDCAGEGWVHGDLLEVGDVPAAHALVFMELRVGYDARWVPVFDADAERGLGRAVAFCWGGPAAERGPLIASGDWQVR